MRGEVQFDALGARWTLFLGTASQCALEQQYDKGFFAILNDAMPHVGPADLDDPVKMAGAMRQLRIGTLRDFAWHGLAKHHPAVTVEQVEDLIDDMGMQAFGSVLGEAIAATRDRIAEADGEGAPARPGKRPTRARGRTGTR